MHVSRGIERGDFKGSSIVESAKRADSAVHDVTGDALSAFLPGDVIGFVERAVINFAIAEVLIVVTFFDKFQFVGFKRVGRASSRGAIEPARAEIICPIRPRHRFVVIWCVEKQSESELFVVIDADGLVRFFFGAREGRKKHARENGNDGDDNEEFDQRECATKRWLEFGAHDNGSNADEAS